MSMTRTKWVAPLVGAWIEIPSLNLYFASSWSLLSWERGLKLTKDKDYNAYDTVAPLVGAWIEIPYIQMAYQLYQVAPLVGAWIEICTTNKN